MPFTYEVTLKGNELREDRIILDSWADITFMDAGEVFAYAHDSTGSIILKTNGPAFLSKRIAKIGQEIGVSDKIAIFETDGESIPYGKPYPANMVADQTFTQVVEGERQVVTFKVKEVNGKKIISKKSSLFN